MRFPQFPPWRRCAKWFLAASWCSGLILGIFAAMRASNILVPMMHSAVNSPASIFGLFAAAVFPFLISIYAVSISEPWLLLIISAYKAFGFSFCACAVSFAFGQSGWLVRFLFLFSDHCLLPLLYLYWLRYVSGDKPLSNWESGACIAAAVLVGCVDYFLISPFLAAVI